MLTRYTDADRAQILEQYRKMFNDNKETKIGSSKIFSIVLSILWLVIAALLTMTLTQSSDTAYGADSNVTADILLRTAVLLTLLIVVGAMLINTTADINTAARRLVPTSLIKEMMGCGFSFVDVGEMQCRVTVDTGTATVTISQEAQGKLTFLKSLGAGILAGSTKEFKSEVLREYKNDTETNMRCITLRFFPALGHEQGTEYADSIWNMTFLIPYSDETKQLLADRMNDIYGSMTRDLLTELLDSACYTGIRLRMDTLEEAIEQVSATALSNKANDDISKSRREAVDELNSSIKNRKDDVCLLLANSPA